MRTRLALATVILAIAPSLAAAQDPTRSIGRQGATQMSFGLFMLGTERSVVHSTPIYNSRGQLIGMDTVEDSYFDANFNATMDIGKFVSDSVVLKVGTIISGSFTIGEDEQAEGSFNAPTVNLLTGLLWYASPGSTGSFYAGADYFIQVNNRGEGSKDKGSVFGRAGLQTLVRDNVALFVEGGYGQALANFGELGLFTTQIGFRIQF